MWMIREEGKTLKPCSGQVVSILKEKPNGGCHLPHAHPQHASESNTGIMI